VPHNGKTRGNRKFPRGRGERNFRWTGGPGAGKRMGKKKVDEFAAQGQGRDSSKKGKQAKDLGKARGANGGSLGWKKSNGAGCPAGCPPESTHLRCQKGEGKNFIARKSRITFLSLSPVTRWRGRPVKKGLDGRVKTMKGSRVGTQAQMACEPSTGWPGKTERAGTTEIPKESAPWENRRYPTFKTRFRERRAPRIGPGGNQGLTVQDRAGTGPQSPLTQPVRKGLVTGSWTCDRKD